MLNIYRAFYIHSDVLGHAELPSLLEAEQRIEKAENMLRQMLQNAKTKFKVSGVMQGPQGPAEKTVTSVTFIKNFIHRLRTQFSEECPQLLEVADVRTFLTLVNEYFNSEMRQVTDTPTVLDCAMNFVEAADETLKSIAWPGYICFTREKEHYELLSDFTVKYEDLLPVPQEPTTCLNKEDVKLLNDWRNEFGRGVRQQSVRNSFTKDKAGTLPFYMYRSVNSDNGDDVHAEARMRELFTAVSTRETNTPTHHHTQMSSSSLGNSNISDSEALPEPEHGNDSDHSTSQVRHTGIYAIRSRSNFFAIFNSDKIEENYIFGTEYVVMDESSFIFKTTGEGASCNKNDIICEIDKGTTRLHDNQLHLTEETFCKILSDCRGECDEEAAENEQNLETTADSEKETGLTGLTTIWSRRRSVRPPRHMEDFF